MRHIGKSRLVQIVLIAAILLAGCRGGLHISHPRNPMKPLIIAHRGASGYLPEHTREAYALAVDQGADFIELDLVITRDRVLIVRHENELSLTTDVASRPEFAARKTSREIDGKLLTGWFSEDFTLSEIKVLRARQRFAFRDTSHDGRYEILTLNETIALADQLSRRTGRTIGIYAELKHPAYFRTIGLPLEEPLLQSLAGAGWVTRTAPVFVQSFDAASLAYLGSRTGVALIQLLDAPAAAAPDELTGAAGEVSDIALQEIATYAVGIGVAKRLVIPVDSTGRRGATSTLVDRARRHGLAVHAWTFRNESQYHRGFSSPTLELEAFLEAGVNGVFTDFPDTAAAVVSKRMEPPR